MADDHTGSPKGPKVFGIGLPYCGEHILPALFGGNGHTWLHHLGGKLAQSVAYAQAARQTPLQDWPDTLGFSGLYSIGKRHLPAMTLRDHLTFLRDTYPDASFIHCHRDPADWVAAQFWADDGTHRAACAWHAGIDEASLPAYWLDEHATYADLCAKVFGGHSRFLSYNVTTDSVEKIVEFLKPAISLDTRVPLPDLSVPVEDIDAVVTHLAATPKQPTPPDADMSFARQISDFCAQTQYRHSKPRVLSRAAVTWIESRSVTDRMGDPLPLLEDSRTGAYLLRPLNNTFERAQATLGELAAHGAKPPLHIDMLDARYLGADGHRLPPRRTIAYNRRKGAKNITLWPLPGYHSLAPTGTPGGFERDDIAFADKDDRCVWLGNVTGRMSPALTPEGRTLRGVYKIRNEIEALGEDSAGWADVIADLDCVPRYRIVKTLRDNPDFDVGLVLRSKWKRHAKTPAFAGLCEPMQPRTYFHRYRYVLSLAGNDTGSNFLLAAASNSLILKEEDGWELFYSDVFKPWVHYVPLEEAAVDVEDKLRWARVNQDACTAMTRAATEVFIRLANPNTRRAYLTAIADRLNDGLG